MCRKRKYYIIFGGDFMCGDEDNKVWNSRSKAYFMSIIQSEVLWVPVICWS